MNHCIILHQFEFVLSEVCESEQGVGNCVNILVELVHVCDSN